MEHNNIRIIKNINLFFTEPSNTRLSFYDNDKFSVDYRSYCIVIESFDMLKCWSRQQG